MTTTDSHATAAAEVRARLHAWAGALRAKDIDGVMSQCAPDVLSFDCHSRLQFRGADALRRHLQSCLPGMPGAMLFENHDLAIAAQGDLAFGHFLVRCGATGADGKEHVSWLRATTCLRKTRGEWMVVHEHLSAPFDPQSGKALLDLEPDHSPRASAA